MLKKVLIAFGVLAVIVVIVFAAVGRKKRVGDSVYAASAAKGDVITVVTGTGVIQPRTKVNISSEIYGQIVDLPVKEGQTVRKGELLVRIDPEKYRSEVDRLSANARVNRIAIESEEVGLRNLELDQKRAKELYRQGVVSISELERADLTVETSRIRLRSLKESVSQAEAALDRAKGDLGKATIFAPMAGRVTQVNTEVGEQVIVGTTNIPGSVLLVISDMSEVIAEVNVDETEVVQLSPGQKAEVEVDAVEKTVYEGRVAEIRNTARREGDVNFFGVKVFLKSPDERLRPGMKAKAKIEVERRESVLRIPIQAVTTRERKKLEEEKKAAGAKKPGETAIAQAKSKEPAAGGTDPASAAAPSGKAAPAVKSTDKGERENLEVVYVIDKDAVRAVLVKTGASDETHVEILEGLKEGDTVVTGPYRVLKKLKEGDRVVKKEEKEEIGESADESSESGSRERSD